MKKKDIKSLSLNKKTISNLKFQIFGGLDKTKLKKPKATGHHCSGND